MGFDPVTMMAVSAGVGAVGSAVGAFGQEQAGEAKAQQMRSAAAAASYRAQVASNNAVIAKQDVSNISQAGEIATTNQGLRTRAVVGQEKAAQGASGIDVNSGSAADVRAGTAEVGMMDALNIRSSMAKSAYAKEVEANSDEAQSQLDQMEAQSNLQGAESAEEGGELGAAGTLLSGASTISGNFAKFKTGGG